MQQVADEAVSHANRADQDLSTATQHLSDVEDWHRRGQLLAMDAGYEMTNIVEQLRHVDTPMGSGVGAGGSEEAGSVDEKGSSRTLARNLEKAGIPRPPLSASHDIVAAAARRARAARRVLKRHDIGINDAVNGQFLPENKSVPNPTDAYVHAKVHTGSYYDYVNERLRRARSREEVEEVLSYVAQKLQHGELPQGET